MIKTERFQQVEIKAIDALREWLIKHHTQEESVWLVTYKKSVPGFYVDRWQVLDQLICFGWIDGIRRKLDDQRTMQLIGPRKTQHWAKSYKERAAKLMEQGLMHEAGLQSIQIAKNNGLWHFMDDVDNLIIPDDLNAALASKAVALSFFEQLNPSSKRFALRWLKLSKTPKTRQNRIQKITHLATKGEKLPGS